MGRTEAGSWGEPMKAIMNNQDKNLRYFFTQQLSGGVLPPPADEIFTFI